MSSLHLSLGTRRQRRRVIKSTILHLVLSISTLLIVTPFLWLFATSIKNVDEIFTRVPRFIPNTGLVQPSSSMRWSVWSMKPSPPRATKVWALSTGAKW